MKSTPRAPIEPQVCYPLSDFQRRGATTVVKVEGVPDALAIHSRLPAGHVAITNICGCRSIKLPHSMLKGKELVVVGDADVPGQQGAERFALHAATTVDDVRLAGLPFEIAPDHGKDVRDFINGGGNVAELLAGAEPVELGSLSHQQNRESALCRMPSITDPVGRTDIANAQRFVALNGENVRYCHLWKKWLIWDGRRWKIDDSGTVTRLAKQVSNSLWKEAHENGNDVALKFAADSAKARNVTAILNLATCDVPVLPSDLDADPWLLNVENGTIELRTGKLREHRPNDLITKLCPVEYDPDSVSGRWERFLDRIFGGDADLIRFVQRWFGYRLTGIITAQLLLILWGLGANGKSTLLDVITWIMGDYADEAPPNLLTERRGGDEHPTEIADLCGKRLIVASESEKGRKMRVQLMKVLTGNARLKGRFNRKDYFSFDRTFEPVLVTNNKPIIREYTEAVWRRMKLVPFKLTIPKAERDPDLIEKLKAEASGILRWLVQGCLDWQQHGLGEPTAITEATAEYRVESEPLHDFIAECCVIGAEYWTKSSDLREVYESFCAERGDRPVGGGDFTDSLKQHNCKPRRRHPGRGWEGIGIVADTTTQNGPSGSEQF